MKKKFSDVYKPVIDSQETITIGHLEINEEPIIEAYVKPNWKTVNYKENQYKKWEADVKKYGGYVDFDHHGGMHGVKVHAARFKNDDESHFGGFTVGSERGNDGGSLTYDTNKYKINEEIELDIPTSIDMTEPLNILIKEINGLKKSLHAQQKIINELQERTIDEVAEIDSDVIEEIKSRLKKLETKKLQESKNPKGWKIERDADGNLERIIPEE